MNYKWSHSDMVNAAGAKGFISKNHLDIYITIQRLYIITNLKNWPAPIYSVLNGICSCPDWTG